MWGGQNYDLLSVCGIVSKCGSVRKSVKVREGKNYGHFYDVY